MIFLLHLCSCLLCISAVQAIDLDIDDDQSLKNAASTAAYGMMTHYHGNETGQIPGKLPDTWWEGGAMFMTLIQYWYATGDTTYDDEVDVGMQWQAGNGDYMPTNWTSYLGNDDQVFWGLAAMTAAELQYPDVSDGYSWLSLAQGVFNTQVERWDTTTCDGGLRWQLFTYQAGYSMKNTISNGGLFQLSARLARYTNNATYAGWAERIWDWMEESPLLNNRTWNVADSTVIMNDCTSQGNNQWTYNYGTMLSGAAYMYAYTNTTSAKTKWQTAVTGLVNVTLSTFIKNSVLYDPCEPTEVCNNNEILFKGLTSVWLAFATTLVPSTSSLILPKLRSSAEAAAEACTGNGNNTCGVRWYTRSWDGWSGLEEQMSATAIFSANLIGNMGEDGGPVTASTGGNSTSHPASGTGEESTGNVTLRAVTTADRAGAGILTAGFAAGWIGLVVWLVV